MDLDRLNRQLDFLAEIDKAKQVLRNTLLMDASRRENDAEHSWHMALGAMLLVEYADCKVLDLLKVVKMALLHDLVEIDAGDTFAYGNTDPLEKARKEALAADRIFGLLPKEQAETFQGLWIEFEKGESQEAKYAQAMDSFMPILHNYRTQGLQWQRLNVTSDQVLSRNRRIEKASQGLWQYIQTIVQDSVEKGYLQA
jgi:putative hydrolases of HD superfamily